MHTTLSEDVTKRVKEAINQISIVPDKDLFDLISNLSLVELTKGSHFSNFGETKGSVGLMLYGVSKQYYLFENGREVTVELYQTGDFLGNYDDLLVSRPAESSISALTDCAIVAIEFENLEKSFSKTQAMERLGRKILEEAFLRSERRTRQLLTNSAEERYQDFRKRFRDLQDSIPGYEIAAYLGITPVSLSRIRAKK